jgi:Na+-transporting methylmalonyl-CoA/oxaloacetate decarboxylase gamma subunit
MRPPFLLQMRTISGIQYFSIALSLLRNPYWSSIRSVIQRRSIMFILFAQAASVTGDGSFSDLLFYQLTGFIIVLSVLCSLWLAVFVMGKLFRILNLKDPVPENSPKPSVASKAPSVSPASTMQVTPELMAVVGAALHTVIQGPFKIVSVEESKSPPKC